MRRRRAARGQGKFYDLLMGMPLILWFGYGAVALRPALSVDARLVLAHPGNLLWDLRFLAMLASAGFNLLLVYLVMVRSTPVRRACGLVARGCGFAGTFLSVGILHLKPVALSFPWQMAAAFFILAGAAGSAAVLAKLGRAFSIMPEARLLVTGGPYAYARHPLYAVEMFTLIGITLQFTQPWALLLAAGVVMLQVVRSFFEERVLAQAFPEYEAYRARTARFIPGLI